MSQNIPAFEYTSVLFQNMSFIYGSTISEEALKYLWAWWVSRQSQPSKEEVRDLFSAFLNELEPRQVMITLEDVQQSDLFSLGEFEDDDESDFYAVIFQDNLRAIGVI